MLIYYGTKVYIWLITLISYYLARKNIEDISVVYFNLKGVDGIQILFVILMAFYGFYFVFVYSALEKNKNYFE